MPATSQATIATPQPMPTTSQCWPPQSRPAPASPYSTSTATDHQVHQPQGIITFQPMSINWSKRNRGQLQRASMKNRITPITFASSTITRSRATGQVIVVARAGQAPEMPAAEEQDHDQERRRDHVQELGHQVHHQLDAGVLGVIAADQLLLGLGQVEGQPGGLGERGHAEDDEAQRLREARSTRRLRPAGR